MTLMFVIRLIRGIASWLWALLQPALRFIGWLLILLAVMTFVADYTRWQYTADAPAATFAQYWRDLAPDTLAAAAAYFETQGLALIWDPVITTVLSLPVWITLGVGAALLMYAGRVRDRLSIYAN
ncbi:MAG: hypothetical protein AAFZ05_14680 [Pseudomonadota bacterium]